MPSPHGLNIYSKTYWGMKHLNGDILCAVDTETTGTDPEVSGIVEVAVLPLNAMLDLHKDFGMFNMKMAPEVGETIDLNAMRLTQIELSDVIIKGSPRERIADMFIDWFESLRLPPGKKIIPLAHNWPFDRSMLIKWLGIKTFEYIFRWHYRDTMMIGNFMNDFADSRREPYPYGELSLRGMCNKFSIEIISAHSAASDAYACAQLYNALLKKGFHGSVV